jgi:hypothetical protein
VAEVLVAVREDGIVGAVVSTVTVVVAVEVLEILLAVKV